MKKLLACALVCAGCASAPVNQAPPTVAVQVDSQKAEVTQQSLTDATVTVTASAVAPGPGVTAKAAHWELVFDGNVIAHGDQKLDQPVGTEPTALLLSGQGTTAADAAGVQKLADHRGGFPIALRGTVEFAGPNGATGKTEFAKATNLREPRLPQVVMLDVGASHYDDGHVNLSFNVAIDNPNPFPVPIESFKYKITVNDQQVADSSAAEKIEVPASSKKVFEVTEELQPSTFKNLDKIYKSNAMKYQLVGLLDVGLAKFDIDLAAPINFTR